eukprot:523580_1
MTANQELPSYAEVGTENVNTVVTNETVHTEAAQLTEEKTNNNDETHSEIPISGCEVQCLATDEKVNTDVTAVAEGGKANQKDEPTQPNSTDETVNIEVTAVTEQTTNNNERLDIFGNPQSKVPTTLTAAERNAYCKYFWEEFTAMVWNWPKLLILICAIGSILFCAAIIGVFEGAGLIHKGNNYKPHASKYPVQIQCLITADKSIESATFECYSQGLYSGATLYEDYVYYEPKCSMINETFSDDQRRIQIGDSCEDEFDPEAGPLRTESVHVNSTMPCYTNINCTDISFYGYIHWESHHTEGAVWLSLSGVFTCIVLGSFVWTRKYFNKSRGNQYCLVIVVWSATLMVIYGLVRLGLWIDSFFNAD